MKHDVVSAKLGETHAEESQDASDSPTITSRLEASLPCDLDRLIAVENSTEQN
jgi:hypothetical protein